MNKKRELKPTHVTVGFHGDGYEHFDRRAKRAQMYENKKMDNKLTIIQPIDEILLECNGKINKLGIFVPNSIAIMLMTMEEFNASIKISFDEIRKMFEINPNDVKEMQERSMKLYDYIAKAQNSFVMGYTALEAFLNISIPDDYLYKSKRNKKRQEEEYLNKEEIERTLSLKEKLEIICRIYGINDLKGKKLWQDLLTYEKLRHSVVHLKSFLNEEYYKEYFKVSTIQIMNTPKDIIKYFLENRVDKNTTEPRWPWIEGTPYEYPLYENEFPLRKIGNLKDGITEDM